MSGDRNERGLQTGKRLAVLPAAAVLTLLLAGCGASLSSLNIFDSNKATTEAPVDGIAAAPGKDDIECPGVQVRTGAAVLSIGNDTKATAEGEPGALNLRYQGTIVRFARECHVAAGVMTMKVGIEGRVITGPAGGPGKVDVPLRIAVVQEGVTPKPVASKFAMIPLEITAAVDRVTFTHIEEGLSFPMPTPAGLIDAYVVYIGFDTMAAQQQKKKPAPRRR
jgi:hypothetical protein